MCSMPVGKLARGARTGVGSCRRTGHLGPAPADSSVTRILTISRQRAVREKELDRTVATSPAAGAVAIATGEPDPDDLPAGTPIGDYVVRRTIAAGGGGIV